MKLYLASDITVGQALTSSALGMGIVFLGLIALMIVVILLSKAMKAGKNTAPAVTETSVVPAVAEAPAAPLPTEPQPVYTAQKTEMPNVPQKLAPGSAGPVLLRGVDEKDAALLMAIVAYRMKKPLCQLRFISIKQVYETGGSN